MRLRCTVDSRSDHAISVSVSTMYGTQELDVSGSSLITAADGSTWIQCRYFGDNPKFGGVMALVRPYGEPEDVILSVGIDDFTMDPAPKDFYDRINQILGRPSHTNPFPHDYPGDPAKHAGDGYTSNCIYKCGAWAGGSRSGAPDGIDPFGECPKHPDRVAG